MNYLVQDQIVREDRNQLVGLVLEITRGKLHCWSVTLLNDQHHTMARSLRLKMLQHSTVLLCVILVLNICTTYTSANPINEWPTSHISPSKPAKPQKIDECGLKGEMQIQSLCQRCAKSTKSDVVYPMCCENSDDARQWCQRYMGFGIHEM